MSEKEEILHKIVQYLDDPENLLLHNEVQNFRTGSPDNEEYYEQIKNLWELSAAAGKLDEIDKDGALDRLAKRLKVRQEEKKSPFLWLRNVAAVLLVGLISYFVYLHTKEPTFITFSSGETVDSISLSDGTKIYLARHSSIRYPDAISKSGREVSLLKGEAFFDVAKDPSRPFTVLIDSLKVTVLGTSFNILSRPDKIDLTVKNGKVMFETPGIEEKAILTAGQGISYDRVQRRSLKYEDKGSNNIAWLTDELTFVDASLPAVFESLERYYSVTIDVEDSLSSFNKFNANFRDNSLDEVLDILRETYPLYIIRDGRHISIKNK